MTDTGLVGNVYTFEIVFDPLSYRQSAIVHCSQRGLVCVTIKIDVPDHTLIEQLIDEIVQPLMQYPGPVRGFVWKQEGLNQFEDSISARMNKLADQLRQKSELVCPRPDELFNLRPSFVNEVIMDIVSEVIKIARVSNNRPPIDCSTPKSYTKLRNYINNITRGRCSSGAIDKICEIVCARRDEIETGYSRIDE
jgi:hypothetical protein